VRIAQTSALCLLSCRVQAAFTSTREDLGVRVLLGYREGPSPGPVFRELVEVGLSAEAVRARDLVAAARLGGHAAIVLEASVPTAEGADLCRRLRASGIGEPIVALVASGPARELVALLDAGADDCMREPCSPRELAARLRALTRRRLRIDPPVLEVDDLRLDPATHEVSRAGAPVELSAKEFALLELFMRRPGEAISRFYLLEHLWDGCGEIRSNMVDVLVSQLRRKLDEPFGRSSLQTVRGIGYRLTPLAAGGGVGPVVSASIAS
jgi:two-component system, OmpR family, response regulator